MFPISSSIYPVCQILINSRNDFSTHLSSPAFPPQLQIFGYNSQLYQNFSDALNRAQGIVAVSVLLQVNNTFPIKKYHHTISTLVIAFLLYSLDPLTFHHGCK